MLTKNFPAKREARRVAAEIRREKRAHTEADELRISIARGERTKKVRGTASKGRVKR
jgi:hypothetical protein